MYTLADKRVMYVPPVVRMKLVELGLQPREPFTICKAERKEGNRRFIEWQVNKGSNSDYLPPSETPPVNGQTNGLGAPKPPSSTRPRKAFRCASEARTCAPWRSACSSKGRAREGCDDRRRRRYDAGGVALRARRAGQDALFTDSSSDAQKRVFTPNWI